MVGFVLAGLLPADLVKADPRVLRAQALITARCVSCHGAEKQEGGLRLDTRAAAIQGGTSGPALVPGKPEESLLVRAVTFLDRDLQMPPKQRLRKDEVELLTEWVHTGAAWPERALSTSPSDGQAPIGDAFQDERNPIRQIFQGERLDLWSLKPVSAASPESSIDEFIRRKLAEYRLQPSPLADRRILLRRVTLGLTGLPPTPQEMSAFLRDDSPEAYRTVVERLLDSPRYGERQSRLWLDVVRYADSEGYERDEFRPLAWQYRDYVIRSLNADKPFDRFIREQLAGDELVDGSPKNAEEVDALIATGYLRLGPWDSTASIFQEDDRRRADMLADLTNTTASAFLGLTISCCQCHDHKYDPFSQADHFRLRAFFAGVTSKDDVDVSLADEQAKIDRHNAAIDGQIAPLNAEQEKLNQDLEIDKLRFDELKQQIAKLVEHKRSPRRAIGVRESGSEIPATHVFYQGDFRSPKDEVAPGFPSVYWPQPAKIDAPRKDTSGRRLTLAKWIASPENPWTARVLVNRVWQQHFGTGLVATPNDFGFTGSPPTHPELLDWLAATFLTDGWSLKALHRRIVLSETYQQSSLAVGPGIEIDPDNALVWRQSVQRLDAETLRDSLLAVCGLLKPQESGPPRWPEVPPELLAAIPSILEAIEGKDEGRKQGWYADPQEAVDVRSVFLVRKRAMPIPFLQVFDLPDSSTSCARRDTTVVAPQTLMLLNSPDGVRYAEALASKLCEGASEVSLEEASLVIQMTDALFTAVLQRLPTDEEQKLSIAFLRQQVEFRRGTSADSWRLAVTDLCRAVLNLNEFAYVD